MVNKQFRYQEFIKSDSYPLFKWVMSELKNQKLNILLASKDKEVIYQLKLQIDVYDEIETLIRSNAETNQEDTSL